MALNIIAHLQPKGFAKLTKPLSPRLPRTACSAQLVNVRVQPVEPHSLHNPAGKKTTLGKEPDPVCARFAPGRGKLSLQFDRITTLEQSCQVTGRTTINHFTFGTLCRFSGSASARTRCTRLTGLSGLALTAFSLLSVPVLIVIVNVGIGIGVSLVRVLRIFCLTV